jgi:hypothetical protein
MFKLKKLTSSDDVASNVRFLYQQPLTGQRSYDPGRLLDALAAQLRLSTDSLLATFLNMAQSVVSKIRRCQLPISATMLIRMGDVSGMTIDEMRCLMGDRRSRIRVAGMVP